MLACIDTKSGEHIVLIQNGKTPFRILNSDAYFYKKEQSIALRLPYNLTFVKKERIRHGAKQVIQDMHSNACVTLYYSQYDEGYAIFNRYCIPNKLTLKNRIDANLYLQDENLEELCVSICFDTKTLTATKETPYVYVNGKIKQHHVLKTGDVIKCLNVVLVYHDDFIMVNTVSNLYRSLEPYSLRIDQPLIKHTNIYVKRNYRKLSLNRVFIEDLDEPLPLPSMNHQPLIFTMGPAITMASASVCSSLVATYNGYLKGRTIYEMLPMILLSSVMLLSVLIWSPMQRHHEKKEDRKMRKERVDDYKTYLDVLRKRLFTSTNLYIKETEEHFLEIKEILEFEDTSLLYEKLPYQKDFLCIFAGIGEETFDIVLNSHFNMKKTDPLRPMIQEVRSKYESKQDVRILTSLKDCDQVVVAGVDEYSMYLQVLLQMTYFHGPDVLKTVFLISKKELDENPYIMHIPHCFLEDMQMRLVATNQNEALELNHILSRYNIPCILVIVFQEGLLKAISCKNMHVIHFASRSGILHNTKLVLKQDGEKGSLQSETLYQTFTTPIIPNINLAYFYQKLSFYHPDDKAMLGLVKECDFFSMYDVEHESMLHIESRWKKNDVTTSIKANIGMNRNLEAITLDFHEKGNGPHGLMAGSTGSGKSEMLITMLLSFAINYAPSALQFVIIDFKGSGLAQNFSNDSYALPHVAGVLSNLDVSEMERALVSFGNECKRREVLFLKLSELVEEPILNLSDYRNHLKKEYKLPQLAALLIVVDEFAELKKEKPEFMNDLMSLARVGRSLGIHLMLATQKPTGVVSDQIWSNSRFKICLKVQDGQDSNEMIETKDASYLKNPGEFYMLCDGLLTYGKSGYANALAQSHSAYVTRLDSMLHTLDTKKEKTKNNDTQLRVIIDEILQLSNKYGRARSLWLSPLEIESIQKIDQKTFKKGIYLGKIDDFYQIW